MTTLSARDKLNYNENTIKKKLKANVLENLTIKKRGRRGSKKIGYKIVSIIMIRKKESDQSKKIYKNINIKSVNK